MTDQIEVKEFYFEDLEKEIELEIRKLLNDDDDDDKSVEILKKQTLDMVDLVYANLDRVKEQLQTYKNDLPVTMSAKETKALDRETLLLVLRKMCALGQFGLSEDCINRIAS
jgi:hypothetical protein